MDSAPLAPFARDIYVTDLQDTGPAWISEALAATHLHPSSPRFKYKGEPREAAVLLPLCIIGGTPSVLFTLRNAQLNSHRGEISFPGGKADPTDPSTEFTALRETHEEIGIPPADVRILGCLPPLPNKTMTLRVHPYVGLLPPMDTCESLRISTDEVESVFALSFHDLTDPARCHMVRFRGAGPWVAQWRVHEHIPNAEIWGLTAFILNSFLLRLHAAKGKV